VRLVILSEAKDLAARSTMHAFQTDAHGDPDDVLA
jgi:hypothetical protein